MTTVSTPPGGPLLTLAPARQLLADLTRRAPLPFTPQPLDKYAFAQHGAIVLGDVAVHGHKVQGKWAVREGEVRAVAASVIRPIDLRDLVPLRAPGQDAPVPASDDWRGRFGYAMHTRGYVGETAAEVARQCDFQTLAGVRFLSVVAWADGWCIPRGYRDMLGRWVRTQRRLMTAARLCAGCGADGGPDYWGAGWRRPTAAGYVTLCTPCTTAGAALYSGELEGTRYRKKLPHNPGRYVCRLCPDRATLWDHCHTHGYVRGPLCWSCNQAESHWLKGADGRAHLWSCVQCRDERTLPVRQLLHLLQGGPVPYRHKGCTWEPLVQWAEEGATPDDGGPVVRVPVICWRHGHRWSEPVPRVDLVAAARDAMAG